MELPTKQALKFVLSDKNPDRPKLLKKHKKVLKIWKFRLLNGELSEEKQEKILKELKYKMKSNRVSATWEINE